MNQDFIIQRAWPEDAGQIAEFEKSNFGGEGFSIRQINYLISKAKGEVLIVKSERKIAASLILLSRKNSSQLRIYSLAVSPALRGKGMAKKMILHAEEKARKSGYKKLSLEVNENNLPAIQLYQACGFQFYRTKKAYYKDGSNALVMKKNLE